MLIDKKLIKDIKISVARSLSEDIGDGDITAQLIPKNVVSDALVVTREKAILCGQAWFDEVFNQLDQRVAVKWLVQDGARLESDQYICKLNGPARSLLTGERVALNFLQTLSGTATTAREYATLASKSGVKILDTRKTIPGLRLAQKYAVFIGGCKNHRLGLYDAFLIKENHITACGGIKSAIFKAKEISPDKPIEVEVESLSELTEALNARVDIVMLDNFDKKMIQRAIAMNTGDTKIEISGNIDKDNLSEQVIMNVDYLSSGSLTKNCKAIDFSMRLLK
jgi:nicotinate-nucleotide pyrophosphorylase (carboxylating)